MKYLMVDNGSVFYSLDGSAASKKPIDQISKDDLLTLLKLAISEESFEMDPYSTEFIHNAAHQIIYKNIYQKFEDIRLHRVSFEDEKVAWMACSRLMNSGCINGAIIMFARMITVTSAARCISTAAFSPLCPNLRL